MARMKDFKDKLNTFKDKFKNDKSDDQTLKLSYNTEEAMANIAVTKDFCTEMKRIGSYGLVTYSISEDDKKKKKSLNTLSLLFSETSAKFPDIDPMRGPLNFSAHVLAKINIITKEFQKDLQRQVIAPLADIEVQCNEIQDLRKKLHDLRRDLGNLNDKRTKLDEQPNHDEQKIHALKDQIDEAETEYENVSDLYVQKILQFEASNFEHAQAINEMVILRTEYHDKCHKELLKIIPEANQYMEERRRQYSFKYSLENHLREIKKCIAYPIEKCVTALSDVEDLRQEGLFRVSGAKSKSNLLCSALNIMKFDQIECKWPPHVLADALKRYLRELPDPLLGKVNPSEWDGCLEKFKSGNKQDAYWQIKELLNKMPKSYYNNLEYLIRFLVKVVQEKSYNLMSVQNICTVFTPNLFRQNNNVTGTVAMNMELSASCNFVLECLLNDTNFFFPHSNQNIASLSSPSPEKRPLPPLPSPTSLPSPPPLSSSPESTKLPKLQILNKDLFLDSCQILYRANSKSTLDEYKERVNDIRSQHRRQRCIESSLFVSGDSISPKMSNYNNSMFGEFDFSSIDSQIPVVPPRRNLNQ